MAETKTYTPEGFKALQDELDFLVNVRVEENKKEISTARSFGDLSENSEYDAAKEEQGKIHARIAELRELLKNILEMLDVLSDAQARRIRAHIILEMTLAETAELEKVSTSAVHSSVQKGLKTIRQKLEPEG